MSIDTATLAENLIPPFVAAILTDTSIVEHLTEYEYRPSDQMVSLAPAQDGFLGLETTRDDTGHWLSVSYWRHMSNYTAWRSTCAERIAEEFPEQPLDSLCHIRVVNINEPIVSERSRHLRANEPSAARPASAGRLPRLSSFLPLISEFFGHVHVR